MRLALFAVFAATSLSLTGCHRANPPEETAGPDKNSNGASSPNDDQAKMVVGGIYSIENGDDSFGIVKILALDDSTVHLRAYKNKFRQRPGKINPAELSLGRVGDPDGFGIGHFPIAKEGFLKDHPVFIMQQPVTEQELEGYKIWLHQGNEQ